MTLDVPNHPELRSCLAHAILADPERWLGEASPSALQAFLSGAQLRAELSATPVATWRIFGPLNDAEFYSPLVARTGNPDLTIRWASALELVHFSMADAMTELRSQIANWFDERGFDPLPSVGGPSRTVPPNETLRSVLARLARRPGMFLGEASSWRLQCYLAGVDRGGDWLLLPPVEGLREIIDGIAAHSRDSYGSNFGAYRIYSQAPADLLAWVGINPE